MTGLSSQSSAVWFQPTAWQGWIPWEAAEAAHLLKVSAQKSKTSIVPHSVGQSRHGTSIFKSSNISTQVQKELKAAILGDHLSQPVWLGHSERQNCVWWSWKGRKGLDWGQQTNPHTKSTPLPDFVNKVLLEYSHPHSFAYYFTLSWQSWVIGTKFVQLQMPKIFTVWPFTESLPTFEI